MASGALMQKIDSEFPCRLIIKTPFPSHRLATTALQALQVDAELSPLVRRKFSLITPPESPVPALSVEAPSRHQKQSSETTSPGILESKRTATGQTVLLTEYRAKTNRMLRVAVNGFMESLGVVLGVMERLDVDVLAASKKSGVAAGTEKAASQAVASARQ